MTSLVTAWLAATMIIGIYLQVVDASCTNEFYIVSLFPIFMFTVSRVRLFRLLFSPQTLTGSLFYRQSTWQRECKLASCSAALTVVSLFHELLHQLHPQDPSRSTRRVGTQPKHKHRPDVAALHGRWDSGIPVDIL